MLIRFSLLITLLITNSVNADWLLYQPIRNSSHKSKIYRDIESHAPTTFNHYDPEVVCHETLHEVNSYLTNKFGSEYNCYYLLNNIGYRIKRPTKFSLRNLADRIPQKYRGSIYENYLITPQPYYKEEPVFVLNEQTAYMAGTYFSLEIKNDFDADNAGYRAFEMMIYCVFLKQMVQQKDIDEIVDYQVKQCHALYKLLPKKKKDVDFYYKNLLEVTKQ